MKKFEGMILACDMDGTLLDDDREISQENEQALCYFTEEGGRFTLATGRAPHAIEPYISQLPFNAPYSLLNGSLILDETHHVFALCRNAGKHERFDSDNFVRIFTIRMRNFCRGTSTDSKNEYSDRTPYPCA